MKNTLSDILEIFDLVFFLLVAALPVALAALILYAMYQQPTL